MALYGASEYPGIFGKALIESLPMLSKKMALQIIDESESGIGHYYIGIGSQEAGTDPANDEVNRKYVDWAKEVDRALASKSRVSRNQHKLVIGEEQVHNETAWSARFAEAIEFLFPAE